jgi:hypothetical protein
MEDFLQVISDKGEVYSQFVHQTTLSTMETVEIVESELDKFVSYWSELTKDGKRQRWQLEKVFEVSRRLGTWFSKINSFQPKQYGKGQPLKVFILKK